MNLGETAFRRCVAGLIAALMLTLGVSLPALEGADLGHEPVVESEHEPGECPQGHDHTICTQVSANHALPVETAGRQDPLLTLQAARTTSDATAALAALTEGNPPRAPPEA